MDSVGPEIVEDGTELMVLGDGFPERRNGFMVLSGSVSIPARNAERVSWRLPILASSSTRVALRLTSEQIHRLADGAPHLTFRGEARVEFPPQRVGGAPLIGTANNVVLDLFDRTATSTYSTSPGEFAQAIGLVVTSDLHVETVIDDSEAALAGLQRGDVLRELDGVRLHSISDFLPSAHGLVSSIDYQRPGFAGTARTRVARASFQTTDPALTSRALALALALALAVLLAARPPRLFVWWMTRKHAVFKNASAALPTASGSISGALSYIIFAIVVSALWALLRIPPGELADLPLLLAGGVVPILFAAFLAGGRRSRPKRFSFGIVGALTHTFGVTLGMLPIVLATLVWASERGSLRLIDFVRHASGWPSSWGLVESPWHFALGLVWLLALVPLVGRRPPVEDHRSLGAGGGMPRALEWFGQLCLAGLWVVLFAGGTAGTEPSSWLGGLLLSVKVLVVVFALGWLRARSGGLRWNETWSLWGWRSLAVSVALAGISIMATSFDLPDAYRDLLGIFSLCTLGAAVVLLVVSALRSFGHRGRVTDPWI